MLDNQLYQLMRQLLTVQAPPRGIVGGIYVQRYQPTQQGRNTDRTILMHKILDKRVGSAKVEQKYIAGVLVDRIETQSMESTFQFTVTQPPAMADADLTHDDVLKITAATMQGQDAQQFLIANGASILRISDIRNTFYINDRGQFEPNPSFDAVIKHNDVFVNGVPYFDTFTFDVFAVPNLPA